MPPRLPNVYRWLSQYVTATATGNDTARQGRADQPKPYWSTAMSSASTAKPIPPTMQ